MAMAWEGLTVAFAKGKKGSGCELGGWVRAGLPIPHTQITLYIYIYTYMNIYIYMWSSNMELPQQWETLGDQIPRVSSCNVLSHLNLACNY